MWVIALLTVMALALTQVQRTEMVLTANQIDSARFRAQSNAILNLVVLNLISQPPTAFSDGTIVWIPDGVPREVKMDGQRFEVTLYNERSKLDLNAVTAQQLVDLIELLGSPGSGNGIALELTPEQIADAVIDWRDENDLALLNGAEDADYESAGLGYGAADEPFRSVEELGQVLGMTPTLVRLLSPHVTVLTQQGGGAGGGVLDESFASGAVLVAAKGYLPEDAQRVVDQRSQGLFPDDTGASGQLVTHRGGPDYQVHIVELRPEGSARAMDALVRIDRASYRLLWKRFGLVSIKHQS